MWDVAVVGAGPAGSAAALGVIAEQPGASVVLLDRDDFPRDKVCGDGVAPHALDVLAGVGVTGLLDDWPVAPRLLIRLAGGTGVEQQMSRPAQVVPRQVLDARLVAAATGRGAQLVRSRVRGLDVDGAGVRLDTDTGPVRARVVIGADGAHSLVRRVLAQGPRPAPVAAQRPGTTAIAVRAYAPVLPEHAHTQVLAFDASRERPAYAWSFPVGDGRANIGYGELVPARGARGAGAGERNQPTRAHLVAKLEELIPGATAGASAMAGHPLPLSTGRARAWAAGRVLLAGDAASLINPVTGEGIYYALASGVAAGTSAGASLRQRFPGARAGERYARALDDVLGAHLHHTDLAARLVRSDRLLLAALAAARRDPGAFDDLADIGLARGRLTGRVVRGMARELVRPRGSAGR